MKSATAIQLNKAWWKKEAPGGLGKVGDDFEKAVDVFAKANAALRDPDEAKIEEFERALDEVEEAAGKVVKEAEKLLKDDRDALKRLEKDKKADKKELKEQQERVKDLENTVKILDKPLLTELANLARNMPDIEGDEDGSIFSDPAQHADYLKKIMPKAKRRSYMFALGFAGKEPTDMRFHLHPKKAGRGLAGKLKSEGGAKKFTFGELGGMPFAQRLGMTDTTARTLVLDIQGKMIPSLAKRVKLMLKKMKVTAFGMVVIAQNGAVLDRADMEAPDEAVDDLDLTEEDAFPTEDELEEASGSSTSTTTETGAPETASDTGPDTTSAPEEAPVASQRAAELKRRLAACLKALAQVPADKRKAFTEVAQTAKARLETSMLDDAEKLIMGLERSVAKLGATTDKPAPEFDAGALAKDLVAIGQRIAGLGNLGFMADARDLGAKAKEIQSMIRAGQLKDASAGLGPLAAAVAEAEARAATADDQADPTEIWNTAKEATDIGLTQLQSALRGFGHPDLDRIAEYGLNGVADGNHVKLRAALMSYKMAGGDAKAKAAEAVRAEAAAYKSFIAGSKLIDLCENNPFGVGVSIKAPLTQALDRIESLVGASSAT